MRLENETVWLTQKLMAELFDKDVRTVNEHIRNIFEEGELVADSVVRKFRITASDGKSYVTQHYNLDVIISVGYRSALDAQTRAVDADFEQAAKQLQTLPKPKKTKRLKP